MEYISTPAEVLKRDRISIGPVEKSGRFHNVLSKKLAACVCVFVLALSSTPAFAQDNQAPVLTAPSAADKSVDEGGTLNIPLAATDADIGDTLTFTNSGLPGFCSFTDDGDRTGDIDCSPGFTDDGTYPVTVTVTDNGTVPGPLFASVAFDIIVGDVNRAPVLTAPTNADKLVDEGGILNIPLAATDADIGDTLTFTNSGLPGFCSFTDDGDRTGDIDCSPGFTDDGTYPVTVTVTDNGTVPGPLFASVAFDIIVGDVNRAPVLTAPSAADKLVDEGGTLNIPLAATDADIGDTLTFITSPLPGFCSFTDDGDRTGDIDCSPGFTDDGTYPVTVTVSDGTPADNASVTFDIVVGDDNQAPALTAPSAADKLVDEGGILNIPLAATDADIGDTLTFTNSGLPGFCSFTDDGDRTGDIDCSPGFTDDGTYPVTVTVTDNGTVPGPLFASVAFDIIVGDVNQAPLLTAPSAVDKLVAEGGTLNIPLAATDADIGDTLTFVTSPLPGFCSFTDDGDRTGDIDCSPGFTDDGTYPVTVTVSDGTPADNASVTFDIVVGDDNQAPVLTAPSAADKLVDEGGTLNIPLTATDADIGDTLTFTTSPLESFCSLTDNGNRTGNLQCTPGFTDAGTYPVTVTVSDGTPADNASVTFDIVVGDDNRAPVLTAPSAADKPVNEGVTLNIPLSATDDDIGDTLTFTTSPLESFCSLTDNGNRTGNLQCTPGFTDAGTYPVTVTVSDGTPADNASVTFDIVVGDANRAPVLDAIDDKTVDELTLLTFTATATDADIPADTLTYSLALGAPLGASITPGGLFTWTPTEAQGPGNFLITVQVTDGVPDNTVDDTEAFAVRVNEVNAAPLLAAIGDKTVDELTLLTFTATATDADVPADTLTYSLGPGAPEGANITAGGLFTWTPTEAQGPRSYPITVQVTDGTPADDDNETITVTVDEVNVVPTANDDVFDVTEGESTVPGLNVLTNDTDPDDALQILTAEFVSGPALDPSFVLNSDGTFSYTHDGSETPSDSFTYQACDDGVPKLCSAAATVTINVDSVNDPPVIEGQLTLSTAEETALLITLADLTVTDADTDPASFVLSVQDGVAPANYTRVGNTITPALDFNGVLSVPVTVNDGDPDNPADSPVFNLAVTVTAVNDAPAIIDQVSLSVPEDASLTILITDVTVLDPDPENIFPDDFTLLLLDGVNYTRVDNTITPDLNFNGALSVVATVSDGLSTSAQFILTVDVSAENDQPVLETPIETQNAVEATPFSLDVSVNFTDADNDPLQFTASGLPASGNLTFDPLTGVFSGTPRVEDARDNDPYIVIVTATDSQPGTTPAQTEFELNISALDRANLSLDIGVAPDPAMLNDELQWTFTVRNSGPQMATNVALTGSFVGSGLNISSVSSCTIQATVGQESKFDCTLGSLPISGLTTVIVTTLTSTQGDVVAFGSAASTDPLPLDPNLDNNSSQLAVGVAEAFSNGAVQVLGRSEVRSIAAGDVDGDGDVDLVVGTAAGQSIQIFLSDGFRDFATSPIALPDNSANEGIALADFDGNGTLDLVVATGGGQADIVYGNDGVGNFTLMATLGATFGQDVAVGDFNNDGFADIVVAAVQGNPVYRGDGAGGFTLHDTLGSANSHAVAVADFDGDTRDDIVFANVGADSQVWIKNAGLGFSAGSALTIGDAVSVTVGEFGGNARPDLAFGRVSSGNGDVPANPVLINDGNGGFVAASGLLGISPTNDILAGDVNRDGLTDLVFINSSGVHQIWIATGAGFELYREQIVDADSKTGVLTELGMTDVGDAGGVDLAMGGAVVAGVGVFLNDGFGNLGHGDAVPPVLTLVGNASVEVPSRSNYVDSGATAEDNIDGDIGIAVVATSNVNTALVGSYTVTYNVIDAAGNSATPITRTVNVTPAAGSGGGGGGGGTLGPLLLLLLAAYLTAAQASRATIQVAAQKQNRRGSENV